MRITPDQRETLRADGYLVVENVVPVALCEAVIEAIAEFLGIDPDDRGTWYRTRIDGHGIVPLHHHPTLWAVRQLPSVHELFADLYGTEALYVTMDRVSFKAPAAGWEEPVRVNGLHWDGDPRRTDARSYQGLLHLRDTDPDQGAFCCAPDVYRDLEAWLREHPDARARADAFAEAAVVSVGGPAGSMVVWDRKMPHSSGRNDAHQPRWVQYVAMDPVDESLRELRVELFATKTAPEWALRQNVAGQKTPEPGPIAELSELGRKLVGFDAW